ncbi:MAG: lysostaphin resistance A-like protein [Bacilli bacterium]
MEKSVKKKTNIVLYTMLMLFIFVFITEAIIYGYGGNLVFNAIVNYPQGSLVIGEAVLAIMVLIVMLLFKNSYVFTQKKESLKTGLFYGLFYLIGSVFFTIIFGVLGGAFKSGLSLINISLGCLLIGICEEFLCRGWLLNEFLERYGDTKKGIWYSIIISGLIFGLMHFGNIFTTGQAVSATITQVFGAIGTGIMFGLIYYKTKNIWSVIILHGFWDFSLILNEIIPKTSLVETINELSIMGILFTILLLAAELLNIIPYIKDIDAKPKKSSVIIFAIISFILYFAFMMGYSTFSVKIGETYEYGNISLEHYAITRDNYEEYFINHTIKRTDMVLDESGEIIENEFNDNYSFKLSSNDKDTLLLANLNTDSYIEIKCESLYDYIIFEDNDNYILAYVEYTKSSNAFLNYVYINKSELSNDSQYLSKIKNNIKKYLLPTRTELLVINDYDNNKSYLGAYHIDYGYYLLTNENEMSILNRD